MGEGGEDNADAAAFDINDETEYESQHLLIFNDDNDDDDDDDDDDDVIITVTRENHNNCYNLRCSRRNTKPITEEVEIEDVVKANVLSLLPAKSLSRFKSVSKDWNNHISNRPLLAHEQSYRFRDLSGFFVRHSDDESYLLPSFVTLNRRCYGVPTPDLGFLPHWPNEDIAVVSSCNGLLLCHVSASGDDDPKYYVCNPVTEQWKDVPRPNYYLGSKPAIVLVFEPSISNIEADYHIACAVPHIDQEVVSFEIYSSRTRSWSCSSAMCVELEEDSNFTGNGCYFNGLCYWETGKRKVLAYDLKNEIYGILTLPLESPRNGILARILGELCYVASGTENDESFIGIYGGTMDMGLRQRIDLSSFEPVYAEVRGRRCRVLCSDDDDRILILVGEMIYCYKLRDQSLQVMCEFVVDGAMDQSVRYLPYVNSLVPVA